VSDVNLSDEYERALDPIGLTLPELWAINRHALDAAFAEVSTIALMSQEFDDWAAGVPELRASPI
jgi:hypothetical protein